MKYVKSLLVLSVFIATTSFADDSQKSPRFLVHLLDYLAKDYGGAVQNGKIISNSEYQEQVEFSNSALETNESLTETKQNPSISEGISKLHKLIAMKASPDEVAKLARRLQTDVINVSHLDVAPSQWPSLKRGQALYAQNCIICHGEKGAGDGVAGKNLNPKPANFLDEHMKEVSPFQAFNTVRLGVPGTAMAPFHTLSDKEVWDVAFYVKSLRSKIAGIKPNSKTLDSDLLKRVATLSDDQLEKSLNEKEKKAGLALAALRITAEDDPSGGNSLGTARTLLSDSEKAYEAKDFESAKTIALRAYLEGIEPVEPRLKATDPDAVSNLETKMAAVRGAIEGRVELESLHEKISIAKNAIQDAETLLAGDSMSPGLAFTAAAAIILREGFEAVLVIIALLGVIRASRSRRAALWVHGGWISALFVGAICWIFAGFLINISGAQRETIEAVTSLFAVAVLVVVGFWLHSQTEVGRWNAFIHGKVQKALEGKNLWGLASIAFIAVFREAIETILFLKAITVGGGDSMQFPVVAGVLSSLALVISMAWAILRFSAKLPIRKLFGGSALVMALLSVILTGKGLHSFQEIGTVGVRNSPISFHIDLLGIYPTWETLLAQFGVFALVVILWTIGKKPSQIIKPETALEST